MTSSCFVLTLDSRPAFLRQPSLLSPPSLGLALPRAVQHRHPLFAAAAPWLHSSQPDSAPYPRTASHLRAKLFICTIQVDSLTGLQL